MVLFTPLSIRRGDGGEAGCTPIPTPISIIKNKRRYVSRHTFSIVLSHFIYSSLLSDSNQRPRDYKSRALANWAKEAGGQAIPIAPLQPSTLALFPTWGIWKELVVGDLSVWNALLTWRKRCKGTQLIYNHEKKGHLFRILTNNLNFDKDAPLYNK